MRLRLLLCSMIGISAANAQFLESELVFGVPIDSYRVLNEFGGAAGSIVLTGRSASGQKHLGLYSIRENSVESEPGIEALLPPEMLFFDAGRLGDDTKLLFLSHRGISELDPVSGTFHLILDISSVYRTPSRAAIRELDFLTDVNQDGLEDVVLPDFDGVRIALQTTQGFDSGIVLDIQPRLRISEGTVSYIAETLHHFDFTLDGKKDIAIVRDNELRVFENTGGGFVSESLSMPINIELADTSREQYEDRVVDIDQSDYRLSRIDRIVDLNGDKLPDILTITTISSGLFNKRTEYGVHLGAGRGGRVRYQAVADAVIPSDGIQVDLSLLEAAGGSDLVSTSFRVGFGEIISALFSRSIKINVELFKIGTEPLYPSQPDYRAKVRLRFSLSTGFVNVPAVRFGDFDGDGFTDLMLQQDTESLEIRAGDSRDFRSEKLTYSTVLPRDGTLIKVVDVNADDRHDILVGFGRGDGESMRNRLHILMGRPTEVD